MKLCNLHECHTISELEEGRASKIWGTAGALALGASGLAGYKYQDRPPAPPNTAHVASAGQEKPKQEEPVVLQTTRQNLDINRLVQFVSHWEGRRAQAYDDSVGVRTVGVGFNLERGDARRLVASVGADYNAIHSGRESLTDAQIDQLLVHDLEGSISSARRIVNNFDAQPVAVQEILIDMVFNLGERGLSNFRSMINAIERNDYVSASEEMIDSRWYKQVGRRSKNHVNTMRGLVTG